MEEAFKPLSHKIKELFGNADALYQIPQYQRPYKWGDEQVDKLWTDLWEAYENNEAYYFLGSVITARPQTQNNYLDVVDGQQRLTTLMILFCVYRDLYPDINEDIVETDSSAIDSVVLKSSISYNERFGRLRLYTHASHMSDFERIILKGNTLDCLKPKKRDLENDVEPRFKFQNTAFIFKERLQKIGEKNAGTFLNFLFNQVKIIRIDCQSVGFAIKLFQVLNDRGLDLTSADLIKSFLLERIYRLYNEDEELKKIKVDQFMADWKECEGIAKHTYESMNDLFVIYEYHLLAANPKRSLNDELQEVFKDKDPNYVIADFKNFCTLYKNDIFDKDDKVIYSLFYIRWAMYWRSILLSALHLKYKDYERLKNALRRFYYLFWVSGYTLSTIKQFSFNLIKWVKDGRAIDEIEKEMEERLNEEQVYRRFIEVLDSSIYNEPWCKPLLFMIEYNQTDNSAPEFLNMDDRNIHVEHILPRAWDRTDGWEHFADFAVDDWMNTGANLTLLSGRKNIEASNNPIDEKIKIYSGKGYYGTDNQKITAFRITQSIVKHYELGTYGKKWIEQSMYDRWNWFCNELEEILSIDLSEIKVIAQED